MTIQQRLVLSFLSILLLFAFNLVIYFWSNAKRGAAVEDLRRAISRQILVASIKQNLNDIQKEIALLSQLSGETSLGGVTPEEIAQFKQRLAANADKVNRLQQLSDDVTNRIRLEMLENDYSELSSSWTIFYENFGVHHAKAITELALRAEPLSQRVLQQLIPQLQEDEKERVEERSEKFYEVARLTDRISMVIFGISSIIAIGVAYKVSKYLTRSVRTLKEAAREIGAGNLEQRISIESKDELGELGQSFNTMTENLHSTKTQLEKANAELEKRNREVEAQRRISESLLLNLLPVQVAAELALNEKVEPKYFEDVTIVFTDFVAFTLATEKLPAEDLVQMLHDYFTEFDRIVMKYGLEKLKTIGDSYMCVGGLPVRRASHPVDAVMAAFEILKAVRDRDRPDNPCPLQIRIGIHTGPVIAGVVGIRKFAYDIWSDTVNHASRMESSGAPNRINISDRSYSRVKDFFECEYRGKLATKERKEFDMYFVHRIHPSLIDGSTEIPPPAFLRRYRVYFHKDPPAFPSFLLNPTPISM